MENLFEFKIVNIVSDIKIHFPPSLTKFSFPRLIFEVSPEDVCNRASKKDILRFALNLCAPVNRCYITITRRTDRNCERGKGGTRSLSHPGYPVAVCTSGVG